MNFFSGSEVIETERLLNSCLRWLDHQLLDHLRGVLLVHGLDQVSAAFVHRRVKVRIDGRVLFLVGWILEFSNREADFTPPGAPGYGPLP